MKFVEGRLQHPLFYNNKAQLVVQEAKLSFSDVKVRTIIIAITNSKLRYTEF